MIKIYWECRGCGQTGCSETLPTKCPFCNSTTGVMEENQMKPNFIECESVEEANRVNMQDYRLVSYSDRRSVYIFTLRLRKWLEWWQKIGGIHKGNGIWEIEKE